MTLPELHALVDIVMDARERTGAELVLRIGDGISLFHHSEYYWDNSFNYPTFSDFTKAVQEYIKSLG